MSEETNAMGEREEIEMLLPWYVTGRLEAADRKRVEAWLARDPDLARQLPLAREEDAETRARAEAISVPATLSVERTLSRVLGTAAGNTRAAQGSQATASLLERLQTAVQEFIFLPAGQIRVAAVAALAAIAVQGAVLATIAARHESTYGVAGGGTSQAAGSYALVRFNEAASAKAIGELLAARNMTIVDGPKPGQLFRVRIGEAGLSEEQRGAKMAGLRSDSTIVSLVLPAQ